MVAEVVGLQTSRDTYRESAVEVLTRVLAEAMDGKVIAVALTVVRPTGSINTAFSDTDNCAALLGGSALLTARLIENIERN